MAGSLPFWSRSKPVVVESSEIEWVIWHEIFKIGMLGLDVASAHHVGDLVHNVPKRESNFHGNERKSDAVFAFDRQVAICTQIAAQCPRNLLPCNRGG